MQIIFYHALALEGIDAIWVTRRRNYNPIGEKCQSCRLVPNLLAPCAELTPIAIGCRIRLHKDGQGDNDRRADR
jgi:hypothetical protein